MATTKSRTTRRPARSTSGSSTSRSSSASSSASSRKSFAARTGKAISDRPVASAAIGTGIVAGVAAAVAGFFAFKRSGKSFGEFSDDVATNLKEKASDARTFVKDGIADAKSKASELADRGSKAFEGEKSQSEIAEEALTLKDTGRSKGKRPVDPVVEDQTKVGAISY